MQVEKKADIYPPCTYRHTYKNRVIYMYTKIPVLEDPASERYDILPYQVCDWSCIKLLCALNDC